MKLVACANDEYYDNIVGGCHLCSEVCSFPDASDFCRASCHDYYVRGISEYRLATTTTTNPPVLSQSSHARSSTVFVSNVDRLIDKPLFWTSIISMVIAVSATIGIIVLCVIRWRAAGRRTRYLAWRRIRPRAGASHPEGKFIADQYIRRDFSELTDTNSSGRSGAKKHASDDVRGPRLGEPRGRATMMPDCRDRYDFGLGAVSGRLDSQMKTSSLASVWSSVSLHSDAGPYDPRARLSFAKEAGPMRTLPPHVQSMHTQHSKTVDSRVTSNVMPSGKAVECVDTDVFSTKMVPGSYEDSKETSVKGLSTDVKRSLSTTSVAEAKLSLESSTSLHLHCVTLLPLDYWSSGSTPRNLRQETEFDAAPVHRFSDTGYRSYTTVAG